VKAFSSFVVFCIFYEQNAAGLAHYRKTNTAARICICLRQRRAYELAGTFETLAMMVPELPVPVL
jgi:hypothetical protein